MMKNYRDMKTHFQTLKTREKLWLIIGGGFVLLFLIYTFLWNPILATTDTLRERVVSTQETLSFLQNADRVLSVSSTKTVKSSSPVDLLSEFQKQVSNEGLRDAFTEMKQLSQNAVSLRFQTIEFNKFVNFLNNALKAYPIKLDKLSMNSLPASGYVDVEMVVSP